MREWQIGDWAEWNGKMVRVRRNHCLLVTDYTPRAAFGRCRCDTYSQTGEALGWHYILPKELTLLYRAGSYDALKWHAITNPFV